MKDNLSRSRIKNTQDLFLPILKRVILEQKDKDLPGEVFGLRFDGIDWDYLLFLSLYHRVENLIYTGLKDCFSELPSIIVMKLKGLWRQSQERNQLELRVAKEVLADFSNIGFKVIPVKGLILSQLLYGDINCRSILCDLDVLVLKSSRLEIEEGFKKIGYAVGEDEEPEGFQWQKDIFRAKDNFCIDLHWNLSRHWQRDAALEEMWKDAHEEYLEGIPYLSLSLEDTLIYLSVHLADGDGYRQLIHICDIARFIHIFKKEINWNKLVDKARRYNLTSSLYYGLFLPKKILGCPLNDTILRELKPGILKRMLVYSFIGENNFFVETFIRKFVREYFNFFLFDFIEAKGIKGYLRLMRLMLFMPKKDGKLSLSQPAKRVMGLFNWTLSEWLKERNKIPLHKVAR